MALNFSIEESKKVTKRQGAERKRGRVGKEEEREEEKKEKEKKNGVCRNS